MALPEGSPITRARRRGGGSVPKDAHLTSRYRSGAVRRGRTRRRAGRRERAGSTQSPPKERREGALPAEAGTGDRSPHTTPGAGPTGHHPALDSGETSRLGGRFGPEELRVGRVYRVSDRRHQTGRRRPSEEGRVPVTPGKTPAGRSGYPDVPGSVRRLADVGHSYPLSGRTLPIDSRSGRSVR